MYEIQMFKFPVTNRPVRIMDIGGNPFWVAPDVTRELGYSNGPDAIKRHCRSKGIVKRDILTNGGMQEVTLIDEANLYRLMGKSNASNAEPFQDWVCEEVLPSIRKTGAYHIVPPAPVLTPAQQALQTAQALVDLETKTLEIAKRQDASDFKVQELSTKINDIVEGNYDDGFRSLVGYSHSMPNLKKKLSSEELSGPGKVAASIWRSLYNEEPKKTEATNGAKYGVNQYPKSFIQKYESSIYAGWLKQSD